VATRYRVAEAFSYAQALKTLGFDSDETPSDEEVDIRHRARVRDTLKQLPEVSQNEAILRDLDVANETLRAAR